MMQEELERENFDLVVSDFLHKLDWTFFLTNDMPLLELYTQINDFIFQYFSGCEKRFVVPSPTANLNWILDNVLLPSFGYQVKSFVRQTLMTAFCGWSDNPSGDMEQVKDVLGYFIVEDTSKELINFLKDKIDEYASSLFLGEFVEPALPSLLEWIDSHLLVFIASVSRGAKTTWRNECISYAPHSLIKLRAKELFDIVVSYPDSTPAIMELRDISNTLPSCLGYLGKQLKLSLCKRLLHMGASTAQIIEFYVSLIRSLRILDPTNILLNFVATPVRQYVISRKDTIRSIVSSLTEGKDDLSKELKIGISLEYGFDSDEENDTADVNWSPPRKAIDFPGTGSQEKDVLTLLVSIYGSTDLFVSEYRSILADRLLQNVSYSIDHEVATLELLKLR
jgi:hypothetical protein